MDVEKLKKMNELSKELKRHGVAADTAEAFAKAGEIVRDNTVGDLISKSVPSERQKECFDSQYQIMLERQNRQLAQEICSIKEKISLIQEEIEKIKQAKPVQPMQAIQQPKQETQTKFPQKAESKEHPRQGGYTSEDVAVDKIFYFGKK